LFTVVSALVEHSLEHQEAGGVVVHHQHLHPHGEVPSSPRLRRHLALLRHPRTSLATNDGSIAAADPIPLAWRHLGSRPVRMQRRRRLVNG
jgi:hypothetical protein